MFVLLIVCGRVVEADLFEMRNEWSIGRRHCSSSFECVMMKCGLVDVRGSRYCTLKVVPWDLWRTWTAVCEGSLFKPEFEHQMLEWPKYFSYRTLSF